VANINDPSLSKFERRELDREASGAHPFWTIPGEGGLDCLVYEDRLPNHPDWAYRATFEVGRFKLQLIKLTFFPATMSRPVGGLTTSVLRNVSLEYLYEMARQVLALPPEVGPALEIQLDAASRVRRSGRQGRSDTEYAQLAAKYVEEVGRGPKPIPRLSERLHVGESSLRGMLNVARGRKLLTDAPPGQAGGELTQKAKDLLDGLR
jgi:hypothetical protein